MTRLLAVLLSTGLLAGCDQLSERAGFPDPAKMEAEGKAIGGACRHAGRGLEDCYQLNPKAAKSAVYEGWKEMNEYMAKNNLQAIPPQLPPSGKAKAQPEGTSSTEGEMASDEPAEAAKAEDGKEQTGAGH